MISTNTYANKVFQGVNKIQLCNTLQYKQGKPLNGTDEMKAKLTD